MTLSTQPALRLDQVFTINGVPEVTFVQPSRWNTLLSNLQTPGRGLVIEGPSGIGKTTAVKQALAQLGHAGAAQILSARRAADLELIRLLPEMNGFGFVVVDDFHRLDDDAKASLADLLKTLADDESTDSKLVVVGINRAGETLIHHAPDVANRLDRLRMEVEPSGKIAEMISKGEAALNISLRSRDGIVEGAHGSFYLAQLLCSEACSEAGVLSAAPEHVNIELPYATVRRNVVERVSSVFDPVFTKFARGTKFRPGGRAPYLQILTWLSEADSWTIALDEEMRQHPKARASVTVVMKNGYLANLVADPDVRGVFHLDQQTKVLAIEDPQAAFYLRSLSLPDFAKRVGFRSIEFTTSYDVALSFAGEDRPMAEALNDELEERGLVVFYDHTEQARILGEDLERFFEPIYSAEADFVVVVLGPSYGQKRWTRFESDAFEERFDQGHVIPIWSKLVPEVIWDKSKSRGGMTFDPAGDLRSQASKIAELVAEKVTTSS